MKKLAFLIPFIVLCLVSYAWDAEILYHQPDYDDTGIYVSNTGSNDSGNGSVENPYRDIQYVLDNVTVPGDTLILRGGIYNEAVRIRQANITIRSRSDEWAVIQTPVDDPEISATFIIDVDADGSKLQRLEIKGGYYYGIMLWTRWDWGDPDDRTGVSRITIEDCDIHHTGRDCIKVTPGCDYIKILRCQVHHSGTRDSGNAEGIDNVNGDYMVVSDCHIHDIATTGLYFKGGASNCIAQRNIVENCGSAGIMLGFDTSPEYFDLEINPFYYENISGIARNNIVENTQYAGIAMYAAYNPRVYNNTLINTAQSAHSAVYFGLTFQDWDPDAGRPPSVNPDIRNNIAVQNGRDMVFIRYSQELGGMSALEGMPAMDNNCYWDTAGNANFADRRPGSYYEGNFAGWQSHISGESHSMLQNPLLILGGFLSPDSPVIDKGTNLSPVVNYDRNSHYRNIPFDMGAYEYGSSDPSISLLYFIARGFGSSVDIRWVTMSETSNAGFNVYRLRADKVCPSVSYSPVKINTELIPGQGNSGSPVLYQFSDSITEGSRFFYILESVSEFDECNQYRTLLRWIM